MDVKQIMFTASEDLQCVIHLSRALPEFWERPAYSTKV
jgi:hypothetical protein